MAKSHWDCVRMEGSDDPRFIELARKRTIWLLGRGGLHGWDLSMMLANAYAQGVYDIVNRPELASAHPEPATGAKT